MQPMDSATVTLSLHGEEQPERGERSRTEEHKNTRTHTGLCCHLCTETSTRKTRKRCAACGATQHSRRQNSVKNNKIKTITGAMCTRLAHVVTCPGACVCVCGYGCISLCRTTLSCFLLSTGIALHFPRLRACIFRCAASQRQQRRTRLPLRLYCFHDSFAPSVCRFGVFLMFSFPLLSSHPPR